MQKYTSKMTSINSQKLPASTSKINWSAFYGKTVLDYGCGRFENLKIFLENTFHIRYFGYDLYWKGDEENELALKCTPDIIICNNVLNVIAEDDIVLKIERQIFQISQETNCDFIIQIYEGNKSGIGSPSKKGCYQRNQPTENYLFHNSLIIKKKLITNNPKIVL